MMGRAALKLLPHWFKPTSVHPSALHSCRRFQAGISSSCSAMNFGLKVQNSLLNNCHLRRLSVQTTLSHNWGRLAPALSSQWIFNAPVRQHNCWTWRPPDKVMGLGETWSYADVVQWPEHYETCGGERQSPVEFVTSAAVRDSDLGDFSFYNFDTVTDVKTTLCNNAHSAQVTYSAGDLVVKGGGLDGDYQVVQYHFHWGRDNTRGSEHTIDGKTFPMELHIVTMKEVYGDVDTARQQPDGLAVLGFFFEISEQENPAFIPLLDALEKIKDAGTVYAMPPFPLANLLPSDLTQYYRYEGGLTTPPCLESVIWTVFKQTITISSKQMDVFRSLRSNESDASGVMKPLVDNYRPVQPLKGRTVRSSF